MKTRNIATPVSKGALSMPGIGSVLYIKQIEKMFHVQHDILVMNRSSLQTLEDQYRELQFSEAGVFNTASNNNTILSLSTYDFQGSYRGLFQGTK